MMNKKLDQVKKMPVSLVVSGDVTMDFNIALSQGDRSNEVGWSQDSSARVYRQRGSALMLTDLIGAVVKRIDPPVNAKDIMRLVSCPQDSLTKSSEQNHSFYAKWTQFAYENGNVHSVKDTAWRVHELLGFQRSPGTSDFFLNQDNDAAGVVLLDDSNLGFRDHESAESWTRALLNKRSPPWVVVKMCSPIAQGNLWNYLHEHHAEKLIALLTIDDLRLTDVQISRGLSWELTAQDLVRELVYNPSVNSLAHCAYVVVSFGLDGAILFARPKSTEKSQSTYAMPECKLFFDPKFIEGEWRQTHPGGMVGYKTCMAASIAVSLLRDLKNPDIENAVKAGLLAMRKLHLEGFGNKHKKVTETNLAFPIDLIADDLVNCETSTSPFAAAQIQHPVSILPVGSQQDPKEPWTILSDRYRDGLEGVARRILIEGPDRVLTDVPLGRFKKLLTVDRREIEGYRSIRSLVNEYVASGSSKPISIAVFGSPGSGKSFGVGQIAESLLPGKIGKLTFNLSQFGSPQDLLGALHQVRDVTLTGKLPLVFWDEFDTTMDGRSLGWLRYFLAPMQDGEFQDGQITHPIGQAVFVFAGGTAEAMDKFNASLADEDKRKEAKLPDFISRIKGFVNVLGPNPTRQNGTQVGKKDNFYLIRRAILLRSIFSRDTPHFFEEGTGILRIDNGILNAFLETSTYKHGVRSMESVIAMSLTKGKRSFERSSLPSEAQLDLHVDANDFMSLVNQIDFSGEMLEKLSHRVHEIYQEIYGFEGDYDSLSEHEKTQNREFATTIIGKLRLCNCLVVADRGIHRQFTFTSEEIDLLAKTEHQRWLDGKIKNNFRYASEKEILAAKSRGDKAKLNGSMLLWDKLNEKDFEKLLKENIEVIGREALPESMKKNNRDLILGIPGILASVGYTIVRKSEA